MKNDLFKRYAPRWFHQLVVGNSVWAVRYGKWPGISRYVITEIRKGSDDKFELIQIERANESTEFSIMGMYNTYLEIDLTRPLCSVWTTSFYHRRVFSDETVAKHSLSQYGRQYTKKLEGRMAIMRMYLNRAKKISELYGKETVKTRENLPMHSDTRDGEQ